MMNQTAQSSQQPNTQQNKAQQGFIRKWFFMGLITSLFGTLVLEHSWLDLTIAQWFYQGHGIWIVDRDAQPWAFIFYDGIKTFLILMSVIVLVIFIKHLIVRQFSQRSKPSSQTPHLYQNHHQPHIQQTKHTLTFLPKPILQIINTFKQLSLSETGFLLSCFTLIPLTVATLKRYTHVVCPIDLQLFGGDMPYLTLWQSILSDFTNKCFPAAHASAGFAVMAVAFICQTPTWQTRWLILGCLLGWLMGGYKMTIGDHFLSHTVTSMGLAWLIASVLAKYWQRKGWLSSFN